MIPGTNLLLAALAVVLMYYGWRPDRGWYWRWVHGRQTAERERIEDALKYLYDCHYTQSPTDLDGLAARLRVDRETAATLCARLEALELLTEQAARLELTAEGRRYALRIIRIHRLWERYLADQTGVSQSRWHADADRVEHSMTMAEADALAEQMGHPLFDPHGDPIPSPQGEVPEPRGVALNQVQPTTWVRVLHVEDEPAERYDQLLAAELYPGMTVRMLENGPGQVCLEVNSQPRTLDSETAANVSVEAIPEQASAALPADRLSSLRIGQSARVADISPACRGLERWRLLDLGLVPGTRVEAELRSFGGDPTAYRVRGAVIALRHEQAELIHIHPPDADAKA